MSVPTFRRWPVILSGRAIREVRQLTRDGRVLDIIRKKIKELSQAQFTTDNQLVVRGTERYIPIYRARMSVDLRIIYTIDLAADSEGKFDHQVIKIFSVSTRARVSYDFWVKISKYLVGYGSEYCRRCTQRKYIQTVNGPLNVPEVFDYQEYVLSRRRLDYNFGHGGLINSETDMNELHETVTRERFLPVTKALYNLILADMEAILPMVLNPDERAIVRHRGTSMVIGRSGTGKTTALVYKMRANAQSAARPDDTRPPRQLFVTRSKVLTQHIARNYQDLMDSSDIANKSMLELEAMRQANEKYQNRELVEFDNSVDVRVDLPRCFGELTDKHFPLFVSFDKLCDLLEGDIIAATGEYALAFASFSNRSTISFSDFKHQYWPRFDTLTHKLNPALVFSEILGVIKGYGDNLTRDEYHRKSKRSPLSTDDRNDIYTIYEAYTRLRLRNHQMDSADRTHKILSGYRVPPESQVDYLFVDEVQDHLMSDVYLIQSLCSNPDGGYWCGDTAQTINAGSSFRMQDLKGFIYESMIPKEVSRSRRKSSKPFPLFELTVNFRSHHGIVRYAASLVELIYTLFPNSIDVLAPESANTPGLPPLLFVNVEGDSDKAEDKDKDKAEYNPKSKSKSKAKAEAKTRHKDDVEAEAEATFVRYLLGQMPIEHAPSFGAQQAIIVRSESTAQSLTRRLQKRCTVITLLETKGLEFDDILLYNFFKESEAPTSSWSAILSLSAHNRDERVQYEKPDPFLTASPVLCSELKHLYVAITRARHRCWLWDSGRTIDAMKVFWEGLKLITISNSLDSLSKFAASSKDLRQWAQRGQEFFSTGLYALAQMCFERAGKHKEAVIAEAYNTMTEAKAAQGAGAKNELTHAAEKMETCANSEKSSHTASTLWYHAATCWHGAQEVVRASSAYCRGGFYNQAAVISFEAQNMDECLKILVSHSKRMDPALVQKIEEATSGHLLRERRYDDLQELFKGNLDQCIALARSLRLPRQLKELLQRNHQLEDLENPSRPETPLSLPDSESQDEEIIEGEDWGDHLSPDDAAHCIQAVWRRSVERQAQRRRLNEFDHEGRLYEEHRLNFPKVGKSSTGRDILALRLIRGPCLSIVLGLQLLAEEMDDYLEHIDDNLKENLSPKDLAEIQKNNKRNQEMLKVYITKINEYLPPYRPPKMIKASNLNGVRTQTKNAWDLFMAVKCSKTIPHDEHFKAIEALLSRGRELVLNGIEIEIRQRPRFDTWR